MDVPVKKLARLLKADQTPEVRAAAALVVAELGIKDAEISSALLALLDDEAEEVRLRAIHAVGSLKVTKALPTLIERVKQGGDESHRAAESAARLGSEGARALQELMHGVSPGLRRYIAAALTGAGAGGAEASAAVLLDKDPHVAMSAATAMISRIPSLSTTQKGDLVTELVSLLGNKKKVPPTAEFPIVRVLASLNDPRAAEVLWNVVLPPHASEVRAAALQALGGWIENPGKDHWRKLFACAADQEFQVAVRALTILNRLPTSKKQLEDWITLLKAPDVAARRMALDKVDDTDTPELAAALMEQLGHPDRGLRDAARSRLGQMEHGRAALVQATLAAEQAEQTWSHARALAAYARSFSPTLQDELYRHASRHLEAGDHRAEALLFLLREVDATALRDRMFQSGVARRKKNDYPTALKYLKLLARDPSVGFPMRLELALCGLKAGAKEIAADSRANDVALKQFEHLIATHADETLQQVQKAKWLEADDLYYLGFHFAERSGAEKDFGIAVLRHLVKTSPKSKPAGSARNKLKSVSV